MFEHHILKGTSGRLECVLRREDYSVQDLEAMLFKELLKRLEMFCLKKRILIGANSHSESEFLHL